jgi:hypothetical protein
LAVAMHFFMACLLDVARHLDDLENQNREPIIDPAHGQSQ